MGFLPVVHGVAYQSLPIVLGVSPQKGNGVVVRPWHVAFPLAYRLFERV